jgi:hypothetical protein
MGLIFLDKNTKETCKKYVEKAEKVIKKSKEKYDLHFMLDKAQVIFHNIYDIVMGLEDDSTKNLFLRWLSLTETLFLNYEWIRFLVD